MPTFSTGNTAWDQGLGNLSGALFPDPSKVAQAGYYGAEQRKAQLESSKIRDQMARQQVADQAANTLTMPATSYAPSPEGPNMPPIMQPPGSAAPPSLSAAVAPGSAAAAPPPPAPAAATPAAPTAVPPPSLSGLLAGNGGPAAAPAPGPSAAPPAAPAAPAAGTVGANMAPGGLSALFAQGGGAVAPAGGGTIRLDQGTPPPVSSPAEGSGAPPAPNNTASDGSVPTNDAVSGVFHPGSITPPGGGTKVTGPANANGSPAKPMITAAQWVNMQVAAGHDANQALLTWRAMISSAYQTGQIDKGTFHDMMSAADPSIINTDSTNAANIKRTGMEQAGATTRTGMEQAGATTRAGMPTTFVADDPSDPTKGHYVPLAQQQGPGGTASFAPAATTTAAGPVLTQAGPGAPVIPSTQGQAARSGTPVYTPGTADITQQQGGAYGTYSDPAHPTNPPVTTTAADARAKGLIPYGTGMLKPSTPQEQNQQSFINHGVDQQIYQQPQKGSLTSPGFVDAPVVFSDAAQAKIQGLTVQIMRSQGGDASSARATAIRMLQGSGDLPSVGQVNALRNQGGVFSTAGGRVSDPRLAQSPTYDGTGKVVPHLWVGLKGETNPNEPNAPTAFNPEPGPRAGSTTAPQPTPGPQQPAPAAPTGPAYRPLADIVGNAGSPPPAPGTPTGPPSVPFFQKFLSRPAATGPTPLTPMQMYGGVPSAAPPAPTASVAAAPSPAPAPNQPIARAAPNQRDGDIAYLNGRPIGIVRGGAVYPMPAQAGPGGGG